MYEVYVMKLGDTLESIATQYETTEGILKQINGINNDLELNPGMMIVVPVNKKQPYQYYTVKKGDNLYDIARDYDIDYNLFNIVNEALRYKYKGI